MTRRTLATLGTVLVAAVLAGRPAQAQQHTATRLGNPATRFAKPLRKPADLRALFRAPELQADIAAILFQSQWPGNLADFRRAAAEATITEIEIPPGTRLPAMSSRERGKPVLLRDVLWAGKKPIDAYEFFFVSQGRRYRVVTPKACSNFWIEDQGAHVPPPRPELRLTLGAPAEASGCAEFPVSVIVHNRGNLPLTQVQLSATLPAGLARVDTQTAPGLDAGVLEPGASREFAIPVTATAAGRQALHVRATSAEGTTAEATATTLVRAARLTLQCQTPAEVPVGRPVQVCLTAGNTGDATESQVRVTLALPPGATCTAVTAGGQAANGQVVWELGDLAPASSYRVCAVFTTDAPGGLSFAGTVQGACAPAARSECQAQVAGIPAILLEVVDLDDPIEVGSDETYVITVTNQGSLPDTNVRLVCTLEPAQQFVSGSGPTAVQAEGAEVTMAALPVLEPKAQAVWRVVVKAVEAGDVRFRVQLESDQITRPVWETEATHQY
ncbi:MAG: DUF11 domain-containing protein [Verrucomicrobiales bacterium]|nr:DUF11 domain-containing protein [Verrucomicrobiales bacterium]